MMDHLRRGRPLFILLGLLGLMGGQLVFTNALAKSTQLFTITPLDDESYAESYTLVARIKDQSYLLVQAMVMNGGIGDEKPACRILYVPHASKKGINEVERGGSWVASKPEGKLRVGSCTLRETASGAVWQARTENLKVDLILKGKKGRFRTKGMSYKENAEESFFDHELIMPWAKMRGQITQKNRSAVQVKGRGTLNHTRSTALPPQVSKRLLKLYLFPKESESTKQGALLEVKQSPKGTLSAWSWGERGSSPLDQSPSALSLPKTWKNGIKRGDQVLIIPGSVPYEFTQIKKMYTYEPIKAYGIAGRLLKRWVGDPLNVTSFVEVRSKHGVLNGFIEEITLR